MARFKDGKWIADYIDEKGQRRRIQCDTKQEAEQQEQQPTLLAKRKEDPTVGEAFPIWAADMWGGTRNERSSLVNMNQIISQLGKDKKVKTICKEDVDALVKCWKERGNALRTVNAKLACLSKLLTYAVEEVEIMETRPRTKFNKVRKGRIRALSANEEGAIIGSLSSPFDKLAVFLLHTGCRVSEARKLKWVDVEFDTESGQATFWDTKNDESRSVPLTRQARAALQYGKDMNWHSPFGGIAYNTFIKKWRQARKEAGLGDDKQVVPHVLRHTCATRLGKGNLDPLRLQKWMGHSSLEMTKRYTHLGTEDLVGGANILEKISR